MLQTVLLAVLVAGQALASDVHESRKRFHPVGVAVGSAPISKTVPFSSIQLNASHPFASIDYGHEVAGYPFFDVSSVSGDVQIEVKYGEEFSALSQPFADGPFLYVNGLSNSYRVETYEIKKSGLVDARYIQGGQRWQSIRLLTSGAVKFRNVGLKPTIDTTNVDDLVSGFQSSSERYNEIWKLGVRASTAACVDAGTQGAMWDISADKGAYIRGMTTAARSSAAAYFEDYDLNFDVYIDRSGFAWSLAQPFGRPTGAHFHLSSNYPADNTYVNNNITLFPANTITVAYGFGFVNATTISSVTIGNFKVPFDVKEKTWYRITSTVTASNRISAAINGTQIFNVSLNDYYLGDPAYIAASLSKGPFGFGGWQDQASYVRNVVAAARNGTVLYKNPMTNADIVLPEYGVHANYRTVCMDGAKRDRLVWLGDFYHTVREIGVSTYRNDHVIGSLQYFLDTRTPSGQLPISPDLGYPASVEDMNAITLPDIGLGYPLADYHVLGLNSFVDYIQYSNNISFASASWSAWKNATAWLIGNINQTNGLVDLSKYPYTLIGPANGMAINGASVQALKGLSRIAKAIGDGAAAQLYAGTAVNLTAAINKSMWNSSGFYALSPDALSDYSVTGLAFAITSGIATPANATSCISHLTALKLGPGYKDSTLVNSSDPTVNLSPNTNGFLLDALMQANATMETKFLLDNLWSAMVTNPLTSSGASWEYVDQSGNPGLSLFTSLSHPWGGAATYVLTQYIAGVRPTTFGYQTFIIEPAYNGFDLQNASATVQTPNGPLSASWRLVDGGKTISVTVCAPNGTEGSLLINGKLGGKGKNDTIIKIPGGTSKTYTTNL